MLIMNDLTITFDPFIKMEGDLFLKDQILNISDRASRILGKYDPQIVFGVMFIFSYFALFSDLIKDKQLDSVTE